MHFHIITLFPEVCEPYVTSSIIGRAQDEGRITVSLYNPRDYTEDVHRRVDDRPYGGGPGMVLQVDPLIRAYEAVTPYTDTIETYILAAQGEQFTNEMAITAAQEEKDIILFAGRYEGIDARVKEITQARELSIGPFVLTGGELPALVVIDAIARQIPGVLGATDSPEEKRAAAKDLYTRPAAYTYNGSTYDVPTVLTSGDHSEIEAWRRAHSTYDGGEE